MSRFGRVLPAFALAILMAVVLAQGAQAQTAKKLNCNGCVKSKQLKNNGIKSKDIKDGQVKNADLANNAVTSAKIADGAVGAAKLGSDVTALGLSGIATVPAAAFVPDTADVDYQNFFGLYIGHNNLGDGFYCANAPVPLPDGAVVNKLEAVVLDDTNAGDLEITLVSYEGLDPFNTRVDMAFLATTGSPDEFETLSTTAITGATVDLAARFYSLMVCLPQSTILVGARVFY